MSFAPLHVRTGYSLLKSGLTIEKLFVALKKNGYSKVGISDFKVLYGLPYVVNYSKTNNFDYALGVEVPFCYKNIDMLISLYAEDEIGYLQLIKISSYLSNHEKLEDNLFDTSHILAILSTAQESILNNIFEQNTNFNVVLNDLSNLFSHFYLGIEAYENTSSNQLNAIREFAHTYGYELIAFPLICYAKKEDAICLKIANAIANDERLKQNEKEEGLYYLRSLEAMEKLYTKDELLNTEKVFAFLNVDFYKKRGHLLHYPNVENSALALKEKALEGLKRLNLLTPIYQERLNYELEVIEKMGYSDYFLIVADYVNYAKENDIPVGPGRGSAASSLVSFALNITTVDPLKYNLLFESFLNPARVSMPDIDIDFGDLKRELVVEYLRTKYGANRVASIVTFHTIGAKQALRDIGRVYDFPANDIDMLAKAIPDNRLTLRDAYRKIPAFRNLVDSDKYYLNIVSLASKIEGLPRQTGLHAAGVVLNNEPLEECLPVIINEDNNYIAQYEMNTLADQGFLKMDILGLRNLTLIENCLAKINSNEGKSLKVEDLPYEDDPAIFSLIASTNTMGIFQLESSGIKRAIKELKPTSFEDIVALLALFRPGPIDNIPVYAKRKAGLEKASYFTPALEEILSPTYGIIVYQEQVLKVVEKIASFSLAEADLFRRAISKKDANKLISMKEKFIRGALNNGYSSELATQIYDHIYRFADYGFKRAHSVAYSIISCKMAYLKAHYPTYFYASILEGTVFSNDSKFNEYISEMKRLGINLILPSINESTTSFISKDKGLLFPLSAIKGISTIFANIIVKERETIPFKDFFDFIIRLYKYKINETQVRNLINAGVFDEFNVSRASLLETVNAALEYASLIYVDYQPDLPNDQIIIPPPMMEIKEDNPLDKCHNEVEVLGTMISKTPLSFIKDKLEKQNIMLVKDIKALGSINFTFAGILKSFKVTKTKKGEPMAFLLFYDDEQEQEVIAFPELYSKCYPMLEKNKIYVIKAHYELKKGNERSCIASDLNILMEDLKNE